MRLSIEDKVEIIELFARQDTAADAGDAEAWLETWGDDVLFESEWGTFADRDGLRDAFTSLQSTVSGTRRFTVNHVIEGNIYTARVTSLLVVVDARAGGVLATATCHDTLHRFGGVWRFAQRRLEVDSAWGRLFRAA